MTSQILIVGEPSEPDFQQVIRWLASRSQLRFVRSSDEAREQSVELLAPQLIVFLQSRPGQFRAAEVEQLHRAWPLARIIMVLGSWCEGEARSGRPCTGTWRIYWYDLVRRMSPILDAPGRFVPASWYLPRSATDAERLMSDLNEEPRPQHGDVLIFADTHDGYEILADACRALNFETTWQRSADSSFTAEYTAGIWDARRGDQEEWRRIREFARAIQPARVVVTQGFPRVDQDAEATENDVTILAKPFQLPDLWRALKRKGTIDPSSSVLS